MVFQNYALYPHLSVAENLAYPLRRARVSRGEIADSLGLTIETVSRQFSELRDLGLIETEGRSALRVIDLPGLSRCAGQLPVAA